MILIGGKQSTHKYIQQVLKQLRWAYAKAKEINEREVNRYKKIYDSKVRCAELGVGDHILVRQKALKGKHKLVDQMENTSYIIKEKIPSSTGI